MHGVKFNAQNFLLSHVYTTQRRLHHLPPGLLGCVTQCSQSAAHSYEQFLQVQQIRFVTLGPLRHA